MSEPKIAVICKTIYIEREDKTFEIKVTDEGIIIDVYVYGDKGDEWIDSPFSATWDEMLPEEADNND